MDFIFPMFLYDLIVSIVVFLVECYLNESNKEDVKVINNGNLFISEKDNNIDYCEVDKERVDF